MSKCLGENEFECAICKGVFERKEKTKMCDKIRRTYIEPFGTVTACVDCGCLISGGVTRCVYCVDRKFPDTRWRRFKKRMRWLLGSVVGWG